VTVTTCSAASDDPAALRQILEDIRGHVQCITGDRELADRLSRVVWELITNLEHAKLDGSAVVVVDLHAPLCRIVVRLPGPEFDSVERSKQPNARGLETTAWRLSLCAWRWSYRRLDGSNEVWLEPRVKR
jgi:hypothetical protein